MKLPSLRNIFSGKKNKNYPLPVSGGVIPANWPWNFWQQGKDPLNANAETAIGAACIDSYAQTVAICEPRHYRYDDDGVKTPVKNSAFLRVMRSPNDYQTSSDIMMNMVNQLLRRGNAYLVGYRNQRNEIEQIHLLDSKSTTPYIDKSTGSVFYALGENPFVGRIDTLVPARDVMHVKLYCPRHPLVGVSPLQNAAAALASNASITAHQAHFFSNMSRPSGVLSTEMELTADQMRQLRAAWDEQSRNMDTGGVPILGFGMKWEPMSITSQDSQVVQAFNMSVEDVARAFRVPLPLVGDLRNGTYSNVETLINAWLSMGLGFMLDHIELSFNKFFGMSPNERTQLNTDVLLRIDLKGRIEAYSKAIQSGLLTHDEARSKFDGLSKVPYGDKPMVQQQMVPLGWTEQNPPSQGEGDEEPPEDPTDEELEELRAISAEYLRKALEDG